MSKSKRMIAVLLSCFIIAGMGASYGVVKNEIKAVKDSLIATYGKKSETVSTLIYNNETYVPLKKMAGLLNKNVATAAVKGKVQITDQTVKTNKLVAVMTMKSGEKVEIELYRDQAPLTVDNFVKLAKSGFYKGLTFHRVIDGFMIQGGDPKGNGTGGPGYTIKGEFMKNGVSNSILHEKGVISMARASNPDSAGSQFFIMLADNNGLNGDYAAFGKVIKGIEVIEKIGKTETDDTDKPTTPQVIDAITIK